MKRRNDKRGPRTPAAGRKPAAALDGGELIDMEAAIAMLKTTRPTFYRWLRTGRIKAMKAGRQWRFYRADIERFLKGQEPRIEVTGDPTELLEALAVKMRALGLKIEDAPNEDGVTAAVHRVLRLALASRASDIHIQPHTDGPEGKAKVRLRLDGVLHELVTFDGRLVAPIVERIKTMAACDVQQKRRPQDGRIRMNIHNEPVDFRVSFVPALFGEAVTLRLLRREALAFHLGDMPYAAKDLERIRHALALPWGMIVVTGPTGAGKTTTLYAAMQELNTPDKKLMSVEDPVEYAFAGVVQVSVNVQEGVTFSTALRSIFRADPDVVMVGEMRDNDTLQICAQIALTGHVALTSLHTNDAPSAFVRMRDLGLDVHLLDTVKLVVAQRLIRSLCRHCSQPVELDAGQQETAAKIVSEGGLSWSALPRNYRRAVGCRECNFTGYRGRTLAAETLAMSGELAQALRERAPVQELRRIAVAQGMTTMIADAVRRAASGETTLEESLRVFFTQLPGNEA